MGQRSKCVGEEPNNFAKRSNFQSRGGFNLYNANVYAREESQTGGSFDFEPYLCFRVWNSISICKCVQIHERKEEFLQADD